MHLQGLAKHDNFDHKMATRLDLSESNANKSKGYGCINYK
jgi:hypothetical protein